MVDSIKANRLNGIGEYYFSQKLREIAELNQQGRNILNLGIGNPDFALMSLTSMDIKAIKDFLSFVVQFQNGIKPILKPFLIQKVKFSL